MGWQRTILAGIAAASLVAGCGKKDEAAGPDAATATDSASAADAAATADAADAGTPATPGSWTPEALEELLAPVALYPDVILGHVLTASTNPQEVLDAGNWLIDNQDLSGDQKDAEAEKLGLSSSVRALIQFPEVMDMLCMKMDWTTELGRAFTADQAGVLDAVQRLRQQAKDVGNLESSPQLKVETETQDGKEIVKVEPPSQDVVYVPKYDPAAVYAPPPANIPPPTTINVSGAGATTVTTQGTTTTVTPATTTTEQKGHSTGALVTTGLLAFGAGILVNEVFDDDDDWDDYYPNYYHGGMYYGGRPYYPPPPYMYRPPYGPGYYPSHGYTRPANYQHGFNNNTIIVNNGGNDYWNRYGNKPGQARPRQAQSPITAAKPRRTDLDTLNRQARERTREAPRTATHDTSRDRPAQGGYAGARPENKATRERMIAKAPPAGVAKDLPKRPTSEYKGATNRPTGASRGTDASRPSSANRPPGARELPQPRPSGAADRGRDHSAAPRPSAGRESPAQRPTPAAASRPASQVPVQQAATQREDRTAFGSGTHSGASARNASARGRGSMGGGGGHKPRKPRH